MESLKEKVLAKVRPSAMSQPATRWQQQKSAGTRARLLEAAIDCLVEKGYARLSTSEVASGAGISRGAMHHYFANRTDLVIATIEYVFYQRMRYFLGDYYDAMRTQNGRKVVETATEMHWQSVQTREYSAYIELAVAARTDAELKVHFEPAMRRFDTVWMQEMYDTFPEWREYWDRIQAVSDFAMVAHMGMILCRPLLREGEREAVVRKMVEQVVMTYHAIAQE